MQRFVSLTLLLLCLLSCRQQPTEKETAGQLTIDTLLVVNTPRGQETDSDIAWILTAKTMIESEHRAYGDDVYLSAAFFVHNLVAEQTTERYYYGSHKAVNLTGMAPTLLRLIGTYGALLQSAYHAEHDYRFLPLCREMELLADAHRTQRKGSGSLLKEMEQVMERQMGPVPRSVFMLGCQYTPLTFGQSMCSDNEYLSLTSFSHHPFGSPCVLEVAQNRYRDTFLNVPIDTLVRITSTALLQGHTVCWEGDLSNKHHTAHTKEVTQESRQAAFDRFETTLNRALLLVGTAHDSHNRLFFIAQDLATGAQMYLSDSFFKMNTVAVTLSANCVPVSTRQPVDQTDIFILPDSI